MYELSSIFFLLIKIKILDSSVFGKKNIIESSLIDSYDISLITPVITREDEDAQKPSFSKVSSRG